MREGERSVREGERRRAVSERGKRRREVSE